MPTLLMWAESDGALAPRLFEGTEAHVDDLTNIGLPNCSHWAQQDRCDRGWAGETTPERAGGPPAWPGTRPEEALARVPGHVGCTSVHREGTWIGALP